MSIRTSRQAWRTSPISRDLSQIENAVGARGSLMSPSFSLGTSRFVQTGTVGEVRILTVSSCQGVQEELLRRIVATGTPTVIVNLRPPYSLNGLEDQAAAVLMAFKRVEGADAIADLLTGKANQAADWFFPFKECWSCALLLQPQAQGGGAPIAYHFGTKCAFGYGLTYTQFAYGELRIKEEQIGIKDERWSSRLVSKIPASGRDAKSFRSIFAMCMLPWFGR
jgi:beta-glucosidase